MNDIIYGIFDRQGRPATPETDDPIVGFGYHEDLGPDHCLPVHSTLHFAEAEILPKVRKIKAVRYARDNPDFWNKLKGLAVIRVETYRRSLYLTPLCSMLYGEWLEPIDLPYNYERTIEKYDKGVLYFSNGESFTVPTLVFDTIFLENEAIDRLLQ